MAAKKIKKSKQNLLLNLIAAPDVLAYVATMPIRPFIVGFAAETDNLLANAKQKLLQKNDHLIVANDVADPSIGFGSEENAVTVLTKDSQVYLPKAPKSVIAGQLLALIYDHFTEFKTSTICNSCNTGSGSTVVKTIYS